MAVGMSDANNNMYSNGINSSDTDLSHNDSDKYLRGFYQKFDNSLNIGDMSGTDVRPRSTSTPFISSTQDRQLSEGWNSNNGWNSDNRWDHNNDSMDGWMDMSGRQPLPDTNSKPGMRAIRKNSHENVVFNTTSYLRTGTESQNQSKDWYNTFVEQTQRFAQLNDRPKHTNGKHVHFEDDDPFEDWKEGHNDTNFGHFSAKNDSQERGQQWLSNSAEETNDAFSSFPKMNRKNSIMDAFCDTILKPVANNFNNNTQYMAQQWSRNMSHIQTTLNNSTIFGDSVWGNPSNPSNSIYRIFGAQEESKSQLHKLLTSVRKAIPRNATANYTWSGQMPRRIRTKTPVYSCKVFLGGIPYDLTDSDLHCTFAQFGHIQIQWPGKDIRSAIEGAAANKAGYVYIIFENYDNVAALLNACTISYRDLDSGCRWYYSISSRRQKSKEVQVIPFDIGDRFFMKSSFSGQMDHSRTVFVGALHGMLAADGLAKVMDDLFGGVIYSGLDTDKYKYPLGSGRVTFDNQDSYLKAVSAAFVEVKSARFKKKIQIDPYIENEQSCVVCRTAIQNAIYCREEGIYFCPKCWESHHSDPESANHRPIVKNKSSKA